MKSVATTAAIIAAIFVSASAVQAASAKTFVASTGTDTGEDCPASAPCATFVYAYSKTNPKGGITCLSSGGFGALSIQKSITVDCLGTSATPGNGYIDVFTAASDRVVLRGVNIQPAGSQASIFSGAGTLILDQVRMSSNSANGISALSFTPNGPGKLVVTDSLFTTGGDTTSGAGILISPAQGGTAQVTLNRVTASGNAFGVAVDGSSSTGGINVTIADSVIASNAQDGVVATTSANGAPIGVFLDNVKSTNNGFGIRSIGSNVTVRVKNSDIVGNTTGLSGGGALITGGGNTVQANATNGVFTGSYPLQ